MIEILKCGYLPSFNIAKPQLKYLTENSGSGKFSAMKPERNGTLENQPEPGTERNSGRFIQLILWHTPCGEYAKSVGAPKDVCGLYKGTHHLKCVGKWVG